MASNFESQIKLTSDTEEAKTDLQKIVDLLGELVTSTKKATVELNDFEKASKKFEGISKSLDSLSGSMKNVGKNLSLYVTAPIIALGAIAVKEFGEAQSGVGRLNLSLQAAGRYSESASSGLREYASQLSKVSTFSQATVISSLGLATNFANTNEQAKLLVKTAADLATFMGTDLESAVRVLGITLNGNAGRLGQQFQAVNLLSEAQLKNGEAIKIVSGIMSGQALNASRSLTGQITILKNQLNDLLESFGEDLAPFVEIVVGKLRDLVTQFQNLDPATRKTILVFALIAAAAGPLLIGLGSLAGAFANIAKVSGIVIAALPAIGAAFASIGAFLTGPGGIVIAIVAAGAGLAGLVNIFFKLRDSGVPTVKALALTWDLFTAAILEKALPAVGKLFSYLFNKISLIPGPLGKAFELLAAGVDKGLSLISGEGKFEKVKAEIDTQLALIGTSSGEAFTGGLSTAISAAVNSVTGMFDQLAPKVKEKANEIATEIATKYTGIALIIQENMTAINTNLSTGLADGFLDFAEGTKTAKQAFADFAKSTLRYISQLIIQQSIFKALQSASPGLFGTTPTVGKAQGGLIEAKNFAAGGSVRGPGSGTSDSIMARLSDGEFVATARAVKKFGPGFYHGLNKMASRSSGVPRFAEGGLASSGGGGPSINIINQGQPKEATSSDFDPQSAVTTVVLEDINRNGPISKSLSGTYGMKRGGFR